MTDAPYSLVARDYPSFVPPEMVEILDAFGDQLDETINFMFATMLKHEVSMETSIKIINEIVTFLNEELALDGI